MMDDSTPTERQVVVAYLDATTERQVAVAYLDAIRLANEGAANDESFRRVVTNLLDRAPATPYPNLDTLSPRYLVDAIQASQGELTVA